MPEICNICNIQFDSITSRHIKTHGMAAQDYVIKYGSTKHYKNLLGTHFGKFLVTGSSTKKFVERSIYWFCRCDCGVTRDVRASDLLSGSSKNCGLCEYIRFRGNNNSKRTSFNKLFFEYRSAANKKRNSFELTRLQAHIIFGMSCFYCLKDRKNSCVKNAYLKKDGGLNAYALSLGYDVKDRVERIEKAYYFYNGIDRIDNSKGYLIDNCVACCRDCNYLKSDKDFYAFTKHIDSISGIRKEGKKSNNYWACRLKKRQEQLNFNLENYAVETCSIINNLLLRAEQPV